MPEIAVNIEVYCAVCGEGICNNTQVARNRLRGEESFRVTPCQKCLDAANAEGYDEGYKAGKDDYNNQGR